MSAKKKRPTVPEEHAAAPETKLVLRFQAKLAEIHQLRRLLAAEKTSVEFWIYEASRWRKEAEDLRRAEAMSRVERGVS